MPQHCVQCLFDVIRLAFLDQQHRTLVRTELVDLILDDRVSNIHYVDRNLRAAECIRDAQSLHRADQRVVETALYDDADFLAFTLEHFVQLVRLDVFDGGGPAIPDFFLFVFE